MSRELLKRCKAFIDLIDIPQPPGFAGFYEELNNYLAQPEPEPVAWALFSKELMPTGAAYAIKRVEIQLAQIEADLGIQDAEIKPLYTSPPDQSARIAELEKHLLAALEGQKAETLLKNAAISSLEQQLAALQAKRESLSEQQILDCAESTWHKFDLDPEVNFKGLVNIARAIEAAHGIGS